MAHSSWYISSGSLPAASSRRGTPSLSSSPAIFGPTLGIRRSRVTASSRSADAPPPSRKTSSFVLNVALLPLGDVLDRSLTYNGDSKSHLFSWFGGERVAHGQAARATRQGADQAALHGGGAGRGVRCFQAYHAARPAGALGHGRAAALHAGAGRGVLAPSGGQEALAVFDGGRGTGPDRVLRGSPQEIGRAHV